MARCEYKYADEREKDEEISVKKNVITYKYRDFLNKIEDVTNTSLILN